MWDPHVRPTSLCVKLDSVNVTGATISIVCSPSNDPYEFKGSDLEVPHTQVLVFLVFSPFLSTLPNKPELRPNPSPPIYSWDQELVQSIAQDLLLSHLLSILLEIA